MTDGVAAVSEATGCTVCATTRRQAGRIDEWRVRGTTRDITGSGDTVFPRGRIFVFCPDCSAILAGVKGLEGSAFFEVVRRAPGVLTEWDYHDRGLLLARIWVASVPLDLDQLADFWATFE